MHLPLGRTHAVAMLMSLVISWMLTPAVRELAIRWGWTDTPEPGSRRVHRRAVPRVGGVAIAAAFYAPLVALLAWRNPISDSLWGDLSKGAVLLLGGFAVVLLGVADDVWNLSAKKKLVVQLAVATLAYAGGHRVELLSNPIGGQVLLGALSYPATVLWIVGIMNSINFLDGLDGLAAGVSLVTASSLLLLGLYSGTSLLQLLILLCLIGALAGFMRYNFNPASIFMGDSGSLFLGFVLAVSAIQTTNKANTLLALLTPMLALGLPIFDMGMAVARRYLLGRSVFAADQEHVHHKLVKMGFSTRQAVLILYSVTLAFGALALMVSRQNWTSLFVVVTVAVLLAVAVRFLGYHHYIRNGRLAAAMQEQIDTQEGRRAVLEVARARIEAAENVDNLFDHLVSVAERMEISSLALELDQDYLMVDRDRFGWSDPLHRSELNLDDTQELRFALFFGEREVGQLVLVGRAGGPLEESFNRLYFELLRAYVQGRLPALVRPRSVVLRSLSGA